MAKSKWKNAGIATSVDIRGNRIPVRVRRPNLDIIKEKGANIRVRDVKGGYKGIFVGTGGGRGPGMPVVDWMEWQKRMNGMIAGRRRDTRKFFSGVGNYGKFINGGKYKSKLKEGKGTTAGIRGKLKNVSGGGKLSWKPWESNFVVYHPVQFATNAIRTAKNPLTRRAEQRNLDAAGRTSADRNVSGRIKRVQAHYETLLRRNYQAMKMEYVELQRAYARMGRGKITPEQFELMKNKFMLRMKNLEEKFQSAEIMYDQARVRIALPPKPEEKHH